MDDLAARLTRMLARQLGGEGPLQGLVRLSGGANMESWSFDWGGQGCVLRRAPSDATMAGRTYGHELEAALVQAAHAAGVKAPRVLGVLQPDDDLGSGYLMARVEAEVRPATILAAPPARLIDDLAAELARLHAITPRPELPLPQADAATVVADLERQFESHGGDRPVLALALRWCHDHLPPPVPPCLVHGDFRMGNLMVDAHGLAAVLDWELSHWGDAHDDLAYGCLAAWRFGHLDQPAFGCSSIERYVQAYQAAGGRPVEPARFRFWLVLRTLWWALVCLQMGQLWRSGADRSLERVVVARRTAEVEVDLLLLLDEEAPAAERRPVVWPVAEPADVAPRHGEPDAAEVLQALREWVEREVKPPAQGRQRFMAAVAANALGQLQREVRQPVAVADRALCDDLRAGRASLATPGLLAHLRRQSLAKLAADSPRYASLQAARAQWTTEPLATPSRSDR